MRTLIESARYRLIAGDPHDERADLAESVRTGLTRRSKRLPCRFLYDEEGSRIFEEICRLPEYYPTRTESGILSEHSDGIAGLFSRPIVLVELGSGSSAKTRLLIESFLKRHGALRYVPVDISRSMLEEASLNLLDHYDQLEVHAIAAEYHAGLAHLRSLSDRPKLIAWLGSNVGNFERDEAAGFLRRVRDAMSSGDRLLLGIDLRKDAAVLERAYDDARGVTARFNRNLLARINRELGGRFELDRFAHRAVYDEAAGCVEIHLVSDCEQSVAIDALDLEVRFARGEAIHTENSYKYSLREIRRLAEAAGFTTERRWLDAERRFSVNVLAPSRAGASAR